MFPNNNYFYQPQQQNFLSGMGIQQQIPQQQQQYFMPGMGIQQQIPQQQQQYFMPGMAPQEAPQQQYFLPEINQPQGFKNVNVNSQIFPINNNIQANTMPFSNSNTFSLPISSSSIIVNKMEGRALTATIGGFKEGAFYAFYVNGMKVIDDICVPEFTYTFNMPGKYNVYVVGSTKSTKNSSKQSLPSNVVNIFAKP